MENRCKEKMMKKTFNALLGLAVAAGGVGIFSVATKYAESRKINISERFADLLVHPKWIMETDEMAKESPDAALAACCAWLIDMAYKSTEGIIGAPLMDPVGYERHAYEPKTGYDATIVTTGLEPEACLKYELTLPKIAKVSGGRRIHAGKLNGTRVLIHAPDSVTIKFDSGYAVNIETNFEFSNSLVPVFGGPLQLSGSASISDNRRNVGRISFQQDGAVAGTITNGDRIVGRISGSISDGITIKRY